MAENIIASCVTGAIGQATGECVGYAKAKVSSSQNLERNYENLSSELAKLEAIRDDCQREIKKHRMKMATNFYDVWLSNVRKIVAKVKTLEVQFEGDRKLSSKYYLKRRSNYSEKVVKLTEEVRKLVEEGRFPKGFLVDKPVEPLIKLNAPDIKEFPALQKPLEQLLDLLTNNKIEKIGIYGPLGVGKTTIMQNLNNHEEVSKLFDIVIWVKASDELTEEKMQEDIARRLRLNLEGSIAPNEVARLISNELKSMKYLLLVDEVTDSIDLHEIGIPDTNNGSKLVLTTEFRHVCSLMADRLVEVHPLSANEAWKMFQQIAFDVIDLPDIKPVAQLVAKECARLPLLIKTVASCFKLKDSVSEWRKGLKDLRRWPDIEIPGLTELHSFLKFCYDQLKDDQKKRCFLYGALYPAESKIYTDYLLECWAAEGLVGYNDGKRSFQDARDEGYDTLKYLTNVSLLEKDEKMTYVLMNNSIRQIALYISSQDPECKFLVGNGENSPALLGVNDWRIAKKISMIDQKLRNLPESPDCKTLSSLLLQKNSNLMAIPESFFRNMEALLVLDLYRTGIQTLPPSICKLNGLKGLYLNNCVLLAELPPQVGELHNLEVLDIRGCRINFMPVHIQNLLHLKCLRVSYYKYSTSNGFEHMDVDNVISTLLRLEELTIEVISYDHWCTEVVDVMQQVSALENLNTLRICIPEAEILNTFTENSRSWNNCQQLISFWFFVGCKNWKRPQILECFKYKINRYLGYCFGTKIDDSAICDVLAETDALELVDHKDITSLSDFVNGASLERIRGCLVEKCNKMTTIVDGNMTPGRITLPNLEQLHIRNLLNLQIVLEGSLSPKCLSKLQIITVKSCRALKKIFSSDVLHQLIRLQKLAIEDCPEVEEVFPRSDCTGQVSHLLSNLETLILRDMPKLKTICAEEAFAWPSFKELQVYGCHGLKSVPFNANNATKLKSIEGEQVWWEALQWRRTEVKGHFQLICSLSVSDELRGQSLHKNQRFFSSPT